MSAQADSLKSVLYALAVNFAIAIGKTVAALYTKSGAMLAEAIHSFADCANQGLLLWGMRASKQVADEDHPLGYGKAIYFWSFVVAILLFSVGGLFSIHEGWHKLHHPEPLQQPWIAIGVLLVSVILESLSMAGCVREVNKIREGRSWLQWFRESRQAELLVVFGEDLAALCGLSIALVAVCVAVVTGDPMFDALGSIAVGVLLVVVAYFVSVEVKAMLVGQSAEAPVRRGIHNYVATAPAVEQVLNIITLHFGDDLMVAVKARMRETVSAAKLSEQINEVEAGLKQAFPQIKWVFFEPDTKK